MAKTNGPTLHAFRTNSPRTARELVTPSWVGSASAIWEAENPGETRRIRDGFTRINAVWDTGATDCVISSELALRLGLIKTGVRTVHYANGPATANEYTVDIVLPNRVNFPNQVVTEGHINSIDDSIHLLIGMSIIAQGDFNLSNFRGTTQLSFSIPGCENRIDLLERAKKRNSRLGLKMVEERWD